MEDSTVAPPRRALHVILIAAVVQGWGLYALHLSIQRKAWPSTEPGVLLALYALIMVVPVTLQLMADRARESITGYAIAGLGLAFVWFGWHHGDTFAGDQWVQYWAGDTLLLFAFGCFVLWLLVLPFLQGRVTSGRWWPQYTSLFTHSWRNVLTLAEAGLFTGLLWLLLFLWQALFRMLGINFFSELFREPIFIYPVTALAFGIALHLIGTLDRLTKVLLDQILNVLKWLAVVAALILALFTVALASKLPALIATGERPISAAWLLWLLAVIVLLINAAYRDGQAGRPYPDKLALAFRALMPLTLVIAATAIWAMGVRTNRYGLTVERVWAWIVAGVALAYAIGYSWAALRKGPWMQGIERTNIIVALALILTLAAALTPIASPYRLAANSQFERAREFRPDVALRGQGREGGTPFDVLRFDTGRYGIARLRDLLQVNEGPNAPRIKETAERFLAARGRFGEAAPVVRSDERALEGLAVFPAGRVLDDALRRALVADMEKEARNFDATAPEAGGLFVDLDGDSKEEFILFANPFYGRGYEQTADGWRHAFTASAGGCGSRNLSDSLKSGAVSTEPRRWPSLRVGSAKFQLDAFEPCEMPAR